jgi:hypothetical protein
MNAHSLAYHGPADSWALATGAARMKIKKKVRGKRNEERRLLREIGYMISPSEE